MKNFEIKMTKYGRNCILLKKILKPKIAEKVIYQRGNLVYTIKENKIICYVKENDEKKKH